MAKKRHLCFLASKNGHRDVVRVLLENGGNPYIQNKYLQTALFPASRWAKPLIVATLLDAGLPANIPDIFGSTPLFYAVESGSVETMELLLSRGADVRRINAMFETALFGTTKPRADESCEFVSKVIQMDVDFKAKDLGLLQGAVKSGNAEVTEIVLNALEEETISAQSTASLLGASVLCGNLDVVKALFSQLPANPDIGRALFAAVCTGSELVDFFLTNTRGLFSSLILIPKTIMDLPLSYVTQMRHNNTEFARLLLQRGVYPNTMESPRADTQASMSKSDVQSQSELSKEALDANDLSARENWGHWFFLAFAAHNGADHLVELRLEYNANPDPINQYGVRPICLAALDGNEAVVRMLLDKKVDPNRVEGTSKAPLSWALKRHLVAYRYDSSRISDWPGCQAVEATFSLLLERGADPNPSDGSSPILAALRLYSEDLGLLPLKAGSSPHVRDMYDRMPLLIATASGMALFVAALLELPDEWTDPAITDIYGRSAIIEATRRNKVDILKLLTLEPKMD
ncbi:ankyrin [Aspergillus neoniger CBS 115656]|uniref:Ankyrin n=1 Tax=Aspergillus neoniger (strain CBS 115656) TaxID=1448310 RepID=A0A318YBR9_ASPNB|nr:ankyrin [Aspergillus neoniger CBS 115656]PYH30130.1 ankyrin [Aspergillus neoniger CBS 115656]